MMNVNAHIQLLFQYFEALASQCDCAMIHNNSSVTWMHSIKPKVLALTSALVNQYKKKKLTLFISNIRTLLIYNASDTVGEMRSVILSFGI